MGFKSGKEWNGNANGRPKKGHTEIDKLLVALKVGAEKYGKTLYEEAVKRALEKSDTLMIALLKKLLPDKISKEGDTERIINIVNEFRSNTKDNRDSTIRKEQETPEVLR